LVYILIPKEPKKLFFGLPRKLPGIDDLDFGQADNPIFEPHSG